MTSRRRISVFIYRSDALASERVAGRWPRGSIDLPRKPARSLYFRIFSIAWSVWFFAATAGVPAATKCTPATAPEARASAQTPGMAHMHHRRHLGAAAAITGSAWRADQAGTFDCCACLGVCCCARTTALSHPPLAVSETLRAASEGARTPAAAGHVPITAPYARPFSNGPPTLETTADAVGSAAPILGSAA